MTLLTWTVSAQEDVSLEELFQVNYDTPLTLDLNSIRTDEDSLANAGKKKKKVNPRIYYGIKAKRGYAKTGFGNNVVVEFFHYLKVYEGPDAYARDFYWFDFKKKKIVNSLKVPKPQYAGVLHGHYKKMLGEQVLEEGYFYKGMKMGRWVKLNRNDILLEKEYYWKGWPKESRLAYYDFEKTQLREVIPVRYSEKDGDYFAYHANGSLAVIGQFRYNYRVGVWREYYPNQRVKREVQYPAEPFDKTPGVIMKEWDEAGNLIYDRKNYQARQ